MILKNLFFRDCKFSKLSTVDTLPNQLKKASAAQARTGRPFFRALLSVCFWHRAAS